ncbi:MAG TPA: hypothetical protein VI485_28250 [Vicinamibacterales bacterium]|nr:hypothetical protein [Vicinamibacterales bacterium]
MIGVAADPIDLDIAAEFFELFKTPWEPVVHGRHYRVVVSTSGPIEDLDADVLLVYGPSRPAADEHAGVSVEQRGGPLEVDWNGTQFLVYGGLASFETDCGVGALHMVSDGRCVEYRRGGGRRALWRVGYDLFSEVRYLLRRGQPTVHARTPTLEIHIAVLRDLLRKSSVPFVEVPPRPLGHDFICCLTHDVDFHGIRRQGFDRTLVGFIARASVGTLVDFLRGRRPFGDVMRNWVALCSLPFVFLRLAPDFWQPFEDYHKAERERPSTFFVVPFKGRPGVGPDGEVDSRRAVPYQASEVREELGRALASGSEVALHGIDAWRDANAGRAEVSELTRLTGQGRVGVRMHWLYFDDDSPCELERAGFDYDSTWGYNDAIGYRAGTSQSFRIPGTQNLMELPLTIMDSALLYPGRMNLSRDEAFRLCHGIVTDARRLGGTLVVNWHDRSLAPERLWGASYAALLADVDQAGSRPWFATAATAVDWYRWRRSVGFVVEECGRVTVRATPSSNLPGARLCVYRPAGGPDPAGEDKGSLEELDFAGDCAVVVNL